MEKINIRSPYFIKYQAGQGDDYVLLDIWIYEGESQADRGPVIWTLSLRTSSVGRVTFEISELIRDYLDVQFNGNYNSHMIWVDYQITPATDLGGGGVAEPIVLAQAFDGYGYFHEGAQTPTSQLNDQKLLQSNNVIYKLKNTSIRIPLIQDSTYTTLLSYKGNLVGNYTSGEDPDSSSRILYLNDYLGTNIDTYEERVISGQGTFEGSSCLTNLLEQFDITPIDRIIIDEDTIVDIVTIEECKNQPIKATFVNKFGALQDIWFFKGNQRAMSASRGSYKSNMLSEDSYSTTHHQNAPLNLNGTEKITINSGFYPESYNEVFKQLLLSEKVWIELDLVTYPVEISSKSLVFKTQLREKLIEYSLNLDFSNDIINNIR